MEFTASSQTGRTGRAVIANSVRSHDNRLVQHSDYSVNRRLRLPSIGTQQADNGSDLTAAREDGSKTIEAFILVLALGIAGDAISNVLNAPVPGAAIGMLLLVAIFAFYERVYDGSARLFEIASPHFTLFFVPAATGIVASTDLLAQVWLQVTVAIVAGTSLTIAITGAIAQYLLRAASREKKQ